MNESSSMMKPTYATPNSKVNRAEQTKINGGRELLGEEACS